MNNARNTLIFMTEIDRNYARGTQAANLFLTAVSLKFFSCVIQSAS
ncbi:MAG: hypothetical protein QX196_08765 [Methylococcaceae bacterium]